MECPLRILISAGEVSGDVVAARIARELRRCRPTCELYGLGGARLADAGVELVATTTHLGSVGITEAIAVAPRLFRCWQRLKTRVRSERPDVAVLVGNDLFHVLVARRLRARGIPTVSVFPPQVWVWRSVAGWIARSFDLILASFPDEERIYRHAGGNVRFVGHYLVDVLSPVTPEERTAARQALGLATSAQVVGLLPGSRGHEVRRIGPALLDAAALLATRDPSLRFTLPVADVRFRPYLEHQIHARGLTSLIDLNAESLSVMRAADLLLVASGTATLEATLLRVPMVIAYRLSAASHAVVRACIRLGLIRNYIVGAPNIALGVVAVPELLQTKLTGSAVAAAAWDILSDPERQRAQRAAQAEAAARLAGGGTLARVAEAVLEQGEQCSSARSRQALAPSSTESVTEPLGRQG